MNRRAWLLFVLVSVLWGIPYLLIKIALNDLSPGVVVAGRVAVAALILLPYAARRGTLTALRGRYGTVALIAVVHVVIPFSLITYGESHISSSLTGLLIAIEPAAIALLMLRTEPLTRGRLTGLAIGFAGVAVLVGLDVSGDRMGLLGAAMVLLAAVSYRGGHHAGAEARGRPAAGPAGPRQAPAGAVQFSLQPHQGLSQRCAHRADGGA